MFSQENYWKKKRSEKNKQIAEMNRNGIKPEYFASACQSEKINLEEVADDRSGIKE